MKGEYISIETSKIMADIEKENKELHDKIDKAIEYIEDNSTNTYLLKSFDIDMLLEILKGE